MKEYPPPLDLKKLRVYPLSQRESLNSLDRMLIDPRSNPPALSAELDEAVADCADKVRAARSKGASVILMYGAHLIKNGAMAIVNTLLEEGWLTHLATNGAGTIHDWELAFFRRTEESVRKNVATGTFGTWDETGRSIQLALLCGGLLQEGYGRALGRFISEDGATLPSKQALEESVRSEPSHPLTPARAELLQMILAHGLPQGRIEVRHPGKQTCILAKAFTQNVPLSVHPGIGYDIFSNHPMFNGAVVGRAAGVDFQLFGRAVEGLEDGVLLSIGSAIMAPQVFEKSLSCVNNLRLQERRHIVRNHRIYVVDLQDGGRWDWSKGEPPKDNPAYYLRFCKTFARMGGDMRYLQCDNVAFLHHLLQRLSAA